MPSAKVLEKKKKDVEALSQKINNAKGMIIADYRGITVEQDTELRRAMRKAGVEYKVVKNTLLKFAVKENGLEDLNPFLEGPTSVAISEKDPVAPAKVMSEFAKKYENLEIKAGVLEGKIIDLNAIKDLAELPSKEELIAKLLGGFNVPISGLVNVLNANIRGLVVALNAIAEQKAQA